MTRALSLLVVAGGLAIAACPPPGPRPPVPAPVPTVDAGGGGPSAATCETVCAHWRELSCKEGGPTPGGITCERVCENVQSSGVIEWDLRCMVAVASCEAIEQCGT